MLTRLLMVLAVVSGSGLRLGRIYGAGLAGAAAISLGVGLFDFRVGLIVAGIFLLLLDGKH